MRSTCMARASWSGWCIRRPLAGRAQARRIRRRGAYVAWIFFMLFAMSIAAVMLALALTGIGFEPAVV
jgi:trk system potassium uptake protein TrkH